jgi:hemolysin III
MRAMHERSQSLGEEIANSVSHGVGLLAAITGVPFLVIAAGGTGTANAVGLIVFAATMVLLYLASTLYHALPAGRAKRVFMRLDHGAIYLFIAGSYTPFALGALSGPYGWTLFAAVWTMAALGIALKAFDRLSHPWLSTGLYLAMGWLVLFAVVPLVERVPAPGIMLLVAGGLAYTLGVAFFMLDSRVRYAHAVWHGFVMTGTGFHFVAVLHYSA